MEKSKKIHCFIVGAKGVSFYGGYESFVQKLLEYHKDNLDIQYHVACKAKFENYCFEHTEETEEREGGLHFFSDASETDGTVDFRT